MGVGTRLRAIGLVLCATLAIARAETGELTLSASSVNVGQPGSPVTIRILRWSTDDERTPVVTALNPAPPAAPAAAGDRGAAPAAGRAARGRGARGRGRGSNAPPLTPTAALTAALGRAPTIGYLWTNDVTGYSIKYAYHAALPDGGERIVLATSRRLGAYSPAWTIASATPTDYEFTVLELRMNPKGLGEGKTSLTTKVVADNEARTLALENYGAAPTILKDVKR